jgi:hypothetical protein
MFKTLKTNLLVIVGLFVISAVFARASEIITGLSITPDRLSGGSQIVGLFEGFAKFIGANACAFLLGLPLGWPTLNRYGNPEEPYKSGRTPGMAASARESFDSGWAGLTPKERFFVYVGVCAVELIAAAICFAK